MPVILPEPTCTYHQTHFLHGATFLLFKLERSVGQWHNPPQERHYHHDQPQHVTVLTDAHTIFVK